MIEVSENKLKKIIFRRNKYNQIRSNGITIFTDDIIKKNNHYLLRLKGKTIATLDKNKYMIK